MNYEPQEVFAVLLLDTKNKVNMVAEISRGTLDKVQVHPREVFKAAVLANANAIICVHNHPSGSSRPSQDDIDLTQRLSWAGDIMGIHVLDHIIIGDGEYTSMKRERLF